MGKLILTNPLDIVSMSEFVSQFQFCPEIIVAGKYAIKNIPVL